MKRKIGDIRNAFPTLAVLPCGHLCVGLEDSSNPEAGPITVKIGDCGVCTKCFQWWEWTAKGMVPYIPTVQELRKVGS